MDLVNYLISIILGIVLGLFFAEFIKKNPDKNIGFSIIIMPLIFFVLEKFSSQYFNEAILFSISMLVAFLILFLKPDKKAKLGFAFVEF